MRISDWSSDVCSSDLPEGKWTGRISAEGGFHFERLWRGVTDHHLIEATFIGSAEARKLHTLAMEQAENYAVASRLVAAKTAAAQNTDEDGEEEIAPVAAKGTTITRPSELLDAVLQSGRKGLSIQRYKGDRKSTRLNSSH